MDNKKPSRRRFLKEGVALPVLAMGGIGSARGQTTGAQTPKVWPEESRAYGKRSSFDDLGRVTESGNLSSGALLTPHQDLEGIITPSPLHYVVSHGNINSALAIDHRKHRFLLHGLVDRQLIFTLEELKRLPSVSRIHFLECYSNTNPTHRIPVGPASNTPPSYRGHETVQLSHGRTSCSEWTGVKLSMLLKEAGLQPGASWLVAEGAEAARLAISIPLEKAMDDAMLAYAQNGEPLRPENGHPLRLLVPGFEGINSVKWLRRIKVVDRPYGTKNETAQHTHLGPDGKARWFMFELGPKSVVTRPSGGQRLPGPGFYEITGLAWSGGGTIRRVEVSTNGGRDWKDAQLQEPVLRLAHTRFRFTWNWNGEEAVLQSRCTDDQGTVQPSITKVANVWGVSLDYFQTTTNSVGRFNPIQPWRVTREGNVQNALWEF